MCDLRIIGCVNHGSETLKGGGCYTSPYGADLTVPLSSDLDPQMLSNGLQALGFWMSPIPKFQQARPEAGLKRYGMMR